MAGPSPCCPHLEGLSRRLLPVQPGRVLVSDLEYSRILVCLLGSRTAPRGCRAVKATRLHCRLRPPPLSARHSVMGGGARGEAWSPTLTGPVLPACRAWHTLYPEVFLSGIKDFVEALPCLCFSRFTVLDAALLFTPAHRSAYTPRALVCFCVHLYRFIICVESFAAVGRGFSARSNWPRCCPQWGHLKPAIGHSGAGAATCAFYWTCEALPVLRLNVCVTTPFTHVLGAVWSVPRVQFSLAAAASPRPSSQQKQLGVGKGACPGQTV